MNDAGWTVDPATVSIAYWWKWHDDAEAEILEAGKDRAQFERFIPQLQRWVDDQRAGLPSSKEAPVDRATRVRSYALASYPTVVTSQEGGGSNTMSAAKIPEVRQAIDKLREAAMRGDVPGLVKASW